MQEKSEAAVRTIRIISRRKSMATYTCDECGTSVNVTCAECEADLVDDSIITDGGDEVRVSKCPDGHGMIKSPVCCAQDMACAV